MLIAFEGVDGSGKSLHTRLLMRWLERSGKCLLTTWNSSKFVSPATKKAKKKRALTPAFYSLIHAADFADRYYRIIEPALDRGVNVIADRYVDTAIARDQARGRRAKDVRRLYSFARKPDITFYLKLPVDVALARKDRKPSWYESGRDIYPACDPYEAFCLYQGQVGRLYDEMEHLTVIDAEKSVRKMQREIRTIVIETLRRTNLS